MQKTIIALAVVLSLPSFADQKEECLASWAQNTKVAASKAEDQASFVRKVLALLTPQQKNDLTVLRQFVLQKQQEFADAQVLQTKELEQISDKLSAFKRGVPPAGLSVEQTVYALQKAEADARQAKEEAQNKVGVAASTIDSQLYRLKSYAFPIFKNNDGNLKAKFIALIEDAQENGFILQIKSSDSYSTYVDYITVQDGGRSGYGRGAGVGYQLGSPVIHPFYDYFSPKNPKEHVSSFEYLGWRAMSEDCQRTLANLKLFPNNEKHETLPAF